MFYHGIVHYQATKQSLHKECIDRGPVHRLHYLYMVHSKQNMAPAHKVIPASSLVVKSAHRCIWQ